MEKYISKSALVAELKKRIMDYWSDSENTTGIYPYALEEVIKYVDTLEVKGVDLEKEIQEVHKHFHDYYGIVNSDTNEFAKVDDIIHIAKHFFELGMSISNKAQKEK